MIDSITQAMRQSFYGVGDSLITHFIASRSVNTLGLSWDGVQYLGRGGLLRATEPAGHSLVLGFALANGLGIWLSLQHMLRPLARWPGVFAPSIGPIAHVSRGQWVGGLLAAAVALVVVAMSPFAEKLMSFAPFVGEVDEPHVSYRQLLLEFPKGLDLKIPCLKLPTSCPTR